MTSSANKEAVLSAPLQGFTTRVWRAAHASVFGGVQVYYAPFMRVEHGAIREKYITEVQREGDVPNLVPQVLAGTPIEMRLMVTTLRDMGHRRIDINLGCPHLWRSKDEVADCWRVHSNLKTCCTRWRLSTT